MTSIQIGPLQLISLMMNLVFGKSIGYSSEVMARSVGRDAWLSSLFAFITGALIITIFVWLARRFAPDGPTDYIPRLLTRPVGVVVMLLLALFFFVSFLTSAITVEQHVNDYMMTETPFILFVVVYTLIILYGVGLGLEVACRLSVLGAGLAILMNLLLIAGSVTHFTTSNLLPMFDKGLLPVVRASAAADTDVAMATTSALFLLPLVGHKQRWLKMALVGIGLGAVLVVIWPVLEIGVMGAEVTAQYLIACMQMARAAELSIYLHRYELLMVVLWCYSVITQSMICLYCCVELITAVLPFKVNRHRLILTVGLLSIPWNWWLAHDRDAYGDFLAHIWSTVAVAIAFGLPLLVALVALLRPKVRHACNQSASG
ncbi:MAG: GerAB/ArcD/ProY family transporter [Mycobacterium leprae]